METPKQNPIRERMTRFIRRNICDTDPWNGTTRLDQLDHNQEQS